jgi:hypothetical protein
MRMKLFIFEPYRWEYCGGAIGIVASTFSEAVNHIVAKAKWEAWITNKCIPHSSANPIEPYYKHSYFGLTSSDFGDRLWDNWILTNVFGLKFECNPFVAFDNWNYA